MTEENQQQAVPEIDYKAEYEKLQEEKIKLAAKNQELIGEKQREAEKRRNAEAVAEAERLEKAKQNGDYESVVKSAQEKEKQWEQRFNELNNKIAQKEVRQAAMRLANELGPLDGDSAETLADYLEKRIKYTENGFNFLDANGNPSVMDSQQLKEEFKNANKFKPLLKGLQATGGGAPGANSSAKHENIVPRTTFDSWNSDRQMSFIKSGGRTHD